MHKLHQFPLAMLVLSCSGLNLSCGNATGDALALQKGSKSNYDACLYFSPEACSGADEKLTEKTIESVCKPSPDKAAPSSACFDGTILSSLAWAKATEVKDRGSDPRGNLNKSNCKFIVSKNSTLGELPKIVVAQQIANSGLGLPGCAQYDLITTDGLGEKACPATYTLVNSVCILSALTAQTLLSAGDMQATLESKVEYLVGVNGSSKRTCLVINQSSLTRVLLEAQAKNKISAAPKNEQYRCNLE